MIKNECFVDNSKKRLPDLIVNLEKAAEAGVTPRQLDLIISVMEGIDTQALISNRFSISRQTVKNHFTAIFRRFNVSDRTQMVMKSLHLGIVEIPTSVEETETSIFKNWFIKRGL